MEVNSNNRYVLVLEDRGEVKNQQEAGKLTTVSGIDDKGKLKTTEPLEANQATFLKFNSKDGLLKNFMTNFLKQFNNTYFRSAVPLQGWRFDFIDVLKKYLVNQYGQWTEYYAPDRTSLRNYLYGPINQIVEIPKQ